MTKDNFKVFRTTLSTPAENAFNISPDSAGGDNLEFATRRVYFGTGGTATVRTVKGDEVTLKNISDGQLLDIRIVKVLDSGDGGTTTATDIIGLY